MEKQPKRCRRRGEALIEAPVILALVVLAVALLIPVLASIRAASRRSQNQTQLRGLHIGSVTWSHLARRGLTNFSPFPGLSRRDLSPTPNGPKTSFAGSGSAPAARIAQLMNGNFFTPEYVIAPADPHSSPAVRNDPAAHFRVTKDNFSYAMLGLEHDPSLRPEWRETQNGRAVVFADRAIGSDAGNVRSDWSDAAWTGDIVFNDNRVVRANAPSLNDTQYVDHPANPTDHLFEDDPDAADALLVHDDAVTAYGQK